MCSNASVIFSCSSSTSKNNSSKLGKYPFKSSDFPIPIFSTLLSSALI